MSDFKVSFLDYSLQKEEITEVLKARKKTFPPEVVQSVQRIIDDVRERGDAALLELTERFDGVKLKEEEIRVSDKEIQEAISNTPEELLDAIRVAIKRVEDFHRKTLPLSFDYRDEFGNLCGMVFKPVRRAGLYIPGGRASYPSTAIMTIVPARVAGVKEIYVCIPPGKEGKINQTTLAAVGILKPDAVFRIGGAQAIAALAYGTTTIPAVDVIAGPGNIYVACAKKLVFGDVGIDMIAGPSEVAIVADRTARPDWIALDIMAQAEHDPEASTFLIADSREVLESAYRFLLEFVPRSERSEIIKASLNSHSYFIQVKSIEEGIELVNMIAPEHLELVFEGAEDYIEKIEAAGTIFAGSLTAESFGDYVLGPNHTLPTQSTARFSSPLSAMTFVKGLNIASVSENGVRELFRYLKAIADAEGLVEHRRAAEARYKHLKDVSG